MFLLILIWLYFLADYGLQTEYVALNKGNNFWAMISHCSIHALFVCLGIILYGFLISFNPMMFVVNLGITLGIYELICHYILDTLKCKKLINYNTDQICHLICKVIWFILILIIL